MEEKNKLIKSLFEQGKITFEQALLLASQQVSGIENLAYRDPEEEEPDPEEEEPLSKIINCVYDDLINVKESRIDVEYIVDIMNERNWTWRDEPVTVARFKTQVLDQVTQVVTFLYDVYKKDQDRDKDEDYFVDYGGVKVSGLLTTNNTLEVTIDFILDTTTSFYDL